MNAGQINYLHGNAAVRARAAREEAATNARQATAVTFTLPTRAAIALAEDAEQRANKATERADDTSKADDYRAHWRERAEYWDAVAATINAALSAERVRR